jgi:hypothetical protein
MVRQIVCQKSDKVKTRDGKRGGYVQGKDIIEEGGQRGTRGREAKE